jgi:queuosine precursor transporter
MDHDSRVNGEAFGAAGDGTPHDLTQAQKLYVWLACLSGACLLISDVLGVKLFSIPLPFKVFGITHIDHTCGMLAFPITFIITDLINEFYGKKAARRVTFISFTMAILAFAVMNLALALPSLDAPYNVRPGSFEDVFASARVMYVASLSAYLVGTLGDIAIFGVIKRLTGGKLIWLRSTGSTILSQMIDSFVVTYLAFSLGRKVFGGEAMPFDAVLKTAGTGYALKFVIAISLTPVIYAGHWIIKNKLGMKPVQEPRRV